MKKILLGTLRAFSGESIRTSRNFLTSRRTGDNARQLCSGLDGDKNKTAMASAVFARKTSSRSLEQLLIVGDGDL